MFDRHKKNEFFCVCVLACSFISGSLLVFMGPYLLHKYSAHSVVFSAICIYLFYFIFTVSGLLSWRCAWDGPSKAKWMNVFLWAVRDHICSIYNYLFLFFIYLNPVLKMSINPFAIQSYLCAYDHKNVFKWHYCKVRLMELFFAALDASKTGDLNWLRWWINSCCI